MQYPHSCFRCISNGRGTNHYETYFIKGSGKNCPVPGGGMKANPAPIALLAMPLRDVPLFGP
jgi:hypothetical protein